MQYNVTVTFRNGATRTKDFDKMEKADRYFNRYNTMLPNPRQPTTQVASVRIEIRDIDGRWAGIRDTGRPWINPRWSARQLVRTPASGHEDMT